MVAGVVPALVQPPAGGRLRAIFGGAAGNLVEWYDWYAYSAAALYFAPVFFPKGDQTFQLLQAAAVFAIGFLVRPIGAWLMGPLCRSCRAARCADTFGCDDVCRLVDYCDHAGFRFHRSGGTRDSVIARVLQGLQRRRRIWHERHLSKRNGG